MLKVKLNTEKLKRFNRDLIRSVLKEEGDGTTKSSLAFETGLSLSTCSNILADLEESGEIAVLGLEESRGGRRSRLYGYNHNFRSLALIYPALEKRSVSLHISVVNTAGEPLLEEIRYPGNICGDDLISLSGELIERFENLSVLSFGMPAVVRKGVIGLCEMDRLSHFDLKGVLERKYAVAVSVGNDVNSAALGYYDSLQSDSPESLVYLYYPEDGISGAGIIVNGRVLRGERDFAGEISFLPLGTSPEKQGKMQKNSRKFLEHLGKTILSVDCLINPGYIVINGNWFTAEFQEELLEKVEKSSPEGQSPIIRFDPHMDDSYRKGLFHRGMKQLSCGFEMIDL